MMRTATWVTLLAGLFIFQSLWNVAAAFCVHESQTSVQAAHFGHHQQSSLCVSAAHASHPVSDQPSDHHHPQVVDLSDKAQSLSQDHHDHLPSMNPILVQNQQKIILPIDVLTHQRDEFFWLNHYQAPDLFLNSPPPELTPLMVG